MPVATAVAATAPFLHVRPANNKVTASRRSQREGWHQWPSYARFAAMNALERAAELLAQGAWQEAHAIVDKEESPLAAWLHGIVHTLEGDLANARYWYGAAGRDFPGPEAVNQEIAEARRAARAQSTAPR
jgi:hypothetical protein